MNKLQQTTLFNLFHDGSVLSLHRKKQDIELHIDIQYLAEIVDPAYTYFRVVLQNCRECALRLWDDEERYYDDEHIMNMLLRDMEIARASIEHDQVHVHCVGGPKNPGGSLIISCGSILLFDEGGQEIMLASLQEVARRSSSMPLYRKGHEPADG
jgi:hypothetical protein